MSGLLWMVGGVAGAVIVAMFMVRVMLVVMETGAPRLRPGWVCGVVGRMGQGKSLWALHRIRHLLRASSPVFVNFTVDTSKHPHAEVYRFDSWESLLEQAVERVTVARRLGVTPRPGLVVLDEAHLFAPASGQVLSPLPRYLMSHARKLYLEVMWITQHESRVASGLRDATAEMIEVKRKSRRGFRAVTWEPENFRKLKAESLWATRYRLSPKVINLYGSWELLRPDELADRDGFIAGLLDRMNAATVESNEGFEAVVSAVEADRGGNMREGPDSPGPSLDPKDTGIWQAYQAH